MGERQIYLDHDHHMMLEAEMFDQLSKAVEDGLISEQEMEDAFLDWLETHRDIQ